MSEPLYKPVYVEVGYRQYELLIVPGPLHSGGQEVWCRIQHPRQRIEVSDACPEDERLRIVAEAVSRAWEDSPGPWRMIPITEPVD